VTLEIDLSKLTVAEKDALILSLLPLAGQLQAALARIAELEARLARFERPTKTPDNSSLPPSKGQKPERPAGARPPRKSRPGVGRTLHPDPDRIVDARLDACPHCAAGFPVERQTAQQVYDRIELPPIRPDVTRVRLFGGRCACCGERGTAAAPAGLEPGSPFGQSIAALVVYLHYAHAIGMERLATLLDEIFSLSISEGAISNMLARAQAPLLTAAAAIQATVTASPVVCSDETSARVSGKTWWEWVFVGTLAVLHVIRPSRGKAVVQALFGAVQPLVWVSDMLGSQRGHAVHWQVCLAHLLRDARYAVSAAIPHSASRSSGCCCAPSRSADDDSGCKTRRSHSIAPIWIAGSTGSWRPCRWANRDASCASASPPTARTCSCSSPTATCHTPTTSPSGISAQASSSAR